ncbi:hypothetical protein PHISCL_00078 [Aspergillus sclerotialis]|uniref:Uncharacterized protein n=1 Tax=Aspergillus sclerotialis TaxID=2070753 RepID=A0A3A2ZZ80_9EURO|nr:hypothetical protein PHISCL_00078 [Aspergillus sclerotialis]
MSSEDKDEIHIKIVVPTPIEEPVVSGITEHLQKIHPNTTLTSITRSEGTLWFNSPASEPNIRDKFGDLREGTLWFNCPSSDPDIRDKFGDLFT